MPSFIDWGESFGDAFGVEEAASTTYSGGGGPLDITREPPPLKPIIFIKQSRDRFKAQRESNARLREQLRIALEGPQAKQIREVIEPRPVDSQSPLHARVDVDAFDPKLIAFVERHYQQEVLARVETARRRELEEDDEEVMLLL